MAIWEQVKRCAEHLTAEGLAPFTRGDLIACIRRTHPQYGGSSINPIIQGMTANTQGGVASPPGKTVLHRVSRGRYVLLRDAEQYRSDSAEIGELGDPELGPPQPKISTESDSSAGSEAKIRFPENEIQTLADRYSYAHEDRSLLDMLPQVRERGYLTKDQLKTIVLWKAPRIAGHVDKNESEFVREITSFAFSAETERARIESLTLLDGVQWPTASVILHLFHQDQYPILDFRALWAVGLAVPYVYTFGFWWPYVEYCRDLARRNQVDMRTLDRALWQFSKENQTSGNKASRAKHKKRAGTANTDRPIDSGSLVPESILSSNAKWNGTVFWVSCVSQKRDERSPASDLYVSDWFSKARTFVESRGAPWFVLSAKYGLVAPEETIEPYELTLNTLPVDDRRRWAQRVLKQLADLPQLPHRVVMLAGSRYREFLEPPLRSMGIEVEVPMEGLRIGEQLSWLGNPSSGRLLDLKLFYALLDQLESKVGGKRTLSDCHSGTGWPERGIYFFYEPGEMRSDTGVGPRVVRVGTHALTENSRASLWSRLAQHRGVETTGGGNHRGSIFRLIVGSAMKRREGVEEPESWGIGGDTGTAASKLGLDRSAIRAAEEQLEQAVSQYIGQMPFLWLDIGDDPGPDSLRGVIERNAIALLSNFDRKSCDPASETWLGRHSDRERVRKSGLWNSNHVDETHDPRFLRILGELIEMQQPCR